MLGMRQRHHQHRSRIGQQCPRIAAPAVFDQIAHIPVMPSSQPLLQGVLGLDEGLGGALPNAHETELLGELLDGRPQ
jgi:hypothetical protein